MADKRFNLLNNFLIDYFNDNSFTIVSSSNDASFRNYFRIKHNNLSFIVMDAPPEKECCESFVKIAKILIKNDIYAPKIIHSNLEQGFLLIEDLGDDFFLDKLQNSFSIDYYKTAIDTLIKIQSIATKSIDIEKYDNELLINEMQLSIDWYFPKLNNKQILKLKKVFNLLAENALNSKQVFVHKDYHSCNLMMLPNSKLGVIDFQDAIIGSNTYDLVSLLKDAYFEIKPDILIELLKYYFNKANIAISFDKFLKQFDLMGLQRHIKILGIFKRLSIRDNKHKYLKTIPLVNKYILDVINKYPELAKLKDIFYLADKPEYAMILAAGMGKRMMPLTKNTPKPLIKIKDFALIEYSIDAIKKTKINNIVINIGYLGNKIKNQLGNGEKFNVNIKYSDESNKLLETAGGVINALSLLGEKPFLIINSDILCDYDLSLLRLPYNSLAHLIMVDNPEHNLAGDFAINNNQINIDGDKKYTFSGIGIYHPNFFKKYINNNKKLTLRTIFEETIAIKKLSGEYYDGYWQDIGTLKKLEFINKKDLPLKIRL